MKGINHHIYTPLEIQLANEIASKLNDPNALSLYLRYTRKYSHDLLREILNQVCSIPDNQIKRSRGALFTYLIGQHADFHYDYTGN